MFWTLVILEILVLLWWVDERIGEMIDPDYECTRERDFDF